MSYLDILNPRWKGKIVINEPTVAGDALDWFTAVAFELVGVDFLRELVKRKSLGPL